MCWEKEQIMYSEMFQEIPPWKYHAVLDVSRAGYRGEVAIWASS